MFDIVFNEIALASCCSIKSLKSWNYVQISVYSSQTLGCYPTEEVLFLVIDRETITHLTLSKNKRRKDWEKRARGYNSGLHPRKQGSSVLAHCTRYVLLLREVLVSRQWNRFDLIFPCSGSNGSTPLASSVMNGGAARSLALCHILRAYAPVWLHFTELWCQEYRSKKDKMKFQHAQAGRTKGLLCVTRVCPSAPFAHRSGNCVKR